MRLELWDVCQNRHRGNPESRAAFQNIKDRLSERQQEVLELIRDYASSGLTVDQIAQRLSTTPNAISGRCTELKIKGFIKKNGTRLTRSGNRAAVLIAT